MRDGLDSSLPDLLLQSVFSSTGVYLDRPVSCSQLDRGKENQMHGCFLCYLLWVYPLKL